MVVGGLDSFNLFKVCKHGNHVAMHFDIASPRNLKLRPTLYSTVPCFMRVAVVRPHGPLTGVLEDIPKKSMHRGNEHGRS